MQRSSSRRESEASDQALVERFQAGATEAFRELVDRHRQAVYLMARRVLESHEDADEAAQEAFVRAWRSLGGFRGDSAVRTWLIRIVLNVARSMQSGRKPTEALDAGIEPPDPRERAEEGLGRRETRSRVRRAVAALPPRQQEAVVLKVFSELTYREVAEVMGLSEGTVKAHLHQAVANLRRNMAPSGAVG